MPSIFKQLLFLFFIVNHLSAQDVSLKVYTDGYEGKKINIWLEDELITGNRTLLKSGVIKTDSISFSLDITEISIIRISLDYQFGITLVEPASNYNIIFPFSKNRANLSLSGNSRIEMVYRDLDSNDINYKISEFNSMIDNFFIEDAAKVIEALESKLASKDKPELNEDYEVVDRILSEKEMLKNIEDLRASVDSIYSDSATYFSDYRNYSFANLELSSGKSRKNVYWQFVSNSGIEYRNIEFIRFFKTYYSEFFEFYSHYPFSEKLIKAFESEESIPELLNIIKSDTLTGTDEMQWLIMELGLYDLYFQTSKWKSRIIEIFEKLKTQNPYIKQRFIADRMHYKLLKGKRGTNAPKFDYIKQNSDTVSLFNDNERLVYIQFFASWNTSAIAEMELMSDLQKRYGRIVRFVSISIDVDLNDFESFVLDNNEFKWEFGWVGEDAKIIREYEISHLPLFYLLDSKGKIISWPSLWPSTGIESIFYKQKHNRKAKSKKSYRDYSPSNSSKDG